MSSSAVTWRYSAEEMSKGRWINNRRWDLAFISLSVVLVPIPYLSWLLMRDVFGVESETGRQAVNLLIAGLIGGPHMYATFTRTALDTDFREKNGAFLLSSLVIPVIVITLALTNLPILLTIFFFIASIHVLHQIVFVVESYNKKGERIAAEKTTLTPLSMAIDYAVVLTSLYPIAAYRIAITQDFSIGPTHLNDVIPSFFEQPWIFYLASAAFGVSAVAFIIKSVIELRNGTAHLPKIIFITFTGIASFIVPSLGNLDTAFQGMNVWHSFQYLALTWYANRLRVQRGELDRTPFVKRLSEDGKARVYYGFNLLLTFGVGVIIGIVFLVLNQVVGGKWTDAGYALETSYYIGVLSFLWIHYYHDHFLFTKTDSLLP